MYLKHLSLTNFRNYTRLELDLPARIIVLQGENAQGKTNLLEAIYYLATTKSPLASSDRQLISWSAEAEVIPHARIEGTFVRNQQDFTLDMTLVKEPTPNGTPDGPALRRQIRLNGIPRRAIDVVGQLNVVLFLPEDIALVAGAPAERRRYLDIMLCQIDSTYCRSLSRYGHVLTQRNALLRQLRERQASLAELDSWDQQMARLGAYVLFRRLWATGELNRQVEAVQPALTGGHENLVLNYQSTIAQRLTGQGTLFDGHEKGLDRWVDEPDTGYIEELFYRTLKNARREEVARAMSVIGPHRDDLRFLINNVDATIYGSRGQQRTVTLAVKLAEVGLMRQRTGEMPILLLDDVISELDQRRARFLMQSISQGQQVLLTTTDLHHYSPSFLKTVVLWQVAGGTVTPLDQSSLETEG